MARTLQEAQELAVKAMTDGGVPGTWVIDSFTHGGGFVFIMTGR